jgi:hypothetical protein
VPAWPPQAPNQLFASHSTLLTTWIMFSLHTMNILDLYAIIFWRRGRAPWSPAVLNLHLYNRLTTLDEDRSERVHIN